MRRFSRFLVKAENCRIGWRAGFKRLVPSLAEQGRQSGPLRQRVPTAAFTLEGYTPRQVAERLGQEGIFVWDGNYYALAVTERLGVEDSGGWCGWGSPTTILMEEVDRLLAVIKALHVR